MNHNLANGMKMLRGNGNTSALLFSLNGLEIVHQERRGQVKTIVMEHLNILFYKPGPANKQHTNQSIINKFLIDLEHDSVTHDHRWRLLCEFDAQTYFIYSAEHKIQVL